MKTPGLFFLGNDTKVKKSRTEEEKKKKFIMGETSEIYYNNRIKLHITFLKDTIHIFIHYVRLKRQNM